MEPIDQLLQVTRSCIFHNNIQRRIICERFYARYNVGMGQFGQIPLLDFKTIQIVTSM